MTKSLIVAVHGASGTQGQSFVRRLHSAGHAVRQITRSPSSAKDRVGMSSVRADLDDPEALLRAYDGADAIVIQLPLIFDDRALAQAETVAQAVERSEVPVAIFNTSGPVPPEPIGAPFVDARVALAAALDGLATRSAVVAPAGPYLENIAAPWSLPLVEEGVIAYPLPAEAPVPWLALDDLGAAALDVLAGAELRPRIIVAGPHAATGEELAKAISPAVGKALRWRTISPDRYREMLAPHLGEDVAAGIAGAYAAAPSPPPPADHLRTGTTTASAWAVAALGRP